MYNPLPRKPQRQNPAHGTSNATKADEHFFPMAIGVLLFSLLLAGNAAPAPQLGGQVFFGGSAQLRGAGAAPINAAIVKDIWGHGPQPCHLSLKAMASAQGAMSIQAISPSQIILQWHAPAGAAPIGCPAAPALLAVSQGEYQRMLQWREMVGHSYFRH